MAGSGKHPHDSGRARAARFRDRAQLEFEDLLIGDFLGGEREPRDDALDCVPIRFDTPKLTAHLSDSAIASAMLDAGVFEENLHDDSIPIDSDLDFNLLDLLADKERSATTAGTARPTVIRPRRERAPDAATHAVGPSAQLQKFSILRFVQGFVVGALAGGAVLALVRMMI